MAEGGRVSSLMAREAFLRSCDGIKVIHRWLDESNAARVSHGISIQWDFSKCKQEEYLAGGKHRETLDKKLAAIKQIYETLFDHTNGKSDQTYSIRMPVMSHIDEKLEIIYVGKSLYCDIYIGKKKEKETEGDELVFLIDPTIMRDFAFSIPDYTYFFRIFFDVEERTLSFPDGLVLAWIKNTSVVFFKWRVNPGSRRLLYAASDYSVQYRLLAQINVFFRITNIKTMYLSQFDSNPLAEGAFGVCFHCNAKKNASIDLPANFVAKKIRINCNQNNIKEFSKKLFTAFTEMAAIKTLAEMKCPYFMEPVLMENPNSLRFQLIFLQDDIPTSFVDGQPYSFPIMPTMQFIEGKTLADWSKRTDLSIKDRVIVLCQILNALNVLHAHKQQHWDLHPQNMIITQREIFVPLSDCINESSEQPMTTDQEVVLNLALRSPQDSNLNFPPLTDWTSYTKQTIYAPVIIDFGTVDSSEEKSRNTSFGNLPDLEAFLTAVATIFPKSMRFTKDAVECLKEPIKGLVEEAHKYMEYRYYPEMTSSWTSTSASLSTQGSYDCQYSTLTDVVNLFTNIHGLIVPNTFLDFSVYCSNPTILHLGSQIEEILNINVNEGKMINESISQKLHNIFDDYQKKITGLQIKRIDDYCNMCLA